MMRIGMIAPLEMRVPPGAYGGTELIVSLLTEELVKRGHDVTLFASGDSLTSARLVAGSPCHLRGSDREPSILNLLNVMACLNRADDFDIIHNHTGLEGMATAALVETPMLTTLHGGLAGDWLLLFKRYCGWHNAISRSASALLPDRPNFAGVIYNAIDWETYPFNAGPRDDHMLFLSRISPEKGAHLAIDLAQRLQRRLIIAGNVHPIDLHYFRTEVEPRLDGHLVRYVGEADYDLKRRLLAGASCLVAPITWDEPFGLFMVEAMACGTPVIALRRGAAPELIRHGITGFLVDDLDGMAAATTRLDQISPYECRRHIEANFSVGRMADDYLAAYRRIVSGGALPEPDVAPEPVFGEPFRLREPDKASSAR
jgi:glycosyltransferase involved in cell wall biosynthesis